jgi:hypothetical protein
MVFCCLVLRAGGPAGCCLLAGQHPLLRPPWSGVSTSVRHTTPITCVLRRWPGPGPCVQATEQSRVSRFGDLATRLKIRPDRHGSPRQPLRSNLTILSETLG